MLRGRKFVEKRERKSLELDGELTRVFFLGSVGKKFTSHKKKLIAFFCYSVGVLWALSVVSFSSSSWPDTKKRVREKRIKIIKRTAKSVYKKYNRLVLRLLQLFMCYVFDYRSWFLCFFFLLVARLCSSRCRNCRWKNSLVTPRSRLHCRHWTLTKQTKTVYVLALCWPDRVSIHDDRYDDNSVKSRSLNLICYCSCSRVYDGEGEIC